MTRAESLALVVGSDAEVVAAGEAVLGRGNAVDAVVAGVFAAAGLHASVLLGPVQMLVGGAGAGLRAIDGRSRQPGLGNPRPRGFRPTDSIAPASRVGVPALPAALLAAVTTYGKLSYAAVLSPAVDLAHGRSKLRGAVLQRIAHRGPVALSEEGIADELTLHAGRMAEGLLSLRDLEEVRPAVLTATSVRSGNRHVVTVPWGATAVRSPETPSIFGANTRIVMAADRNGLVAIAAYEVHKEGLFLEPLDLLAPFTAAPVLRGETRVRPGDPRSAAAPIALGESRGVLDLVVGIGAASEGEAALGTWLPSYQLVSELERAGSLPADLLALQRTGSGWSRV